MNRAARLAFILLVPLAVLTSACEDLPEAPNVPPTAAFIYNPVSPIVAGETAVSFNAAGTRDTDGRVASYVWTFGDGTPDVTTEAPNVTHVFPDTAARCLEVTYAVLLTAVDDQGERGVASQQVKVIEAPLPSSVQCAR